MPVESCEYDGHQEQSAIDSAKVALYGQLLALDSRLVDMLDITSVDCDLHADEITLHMYVGSAVDGLKLSDMTRDDKLIIELVAKIRLKMTENVQSFSFGSVEDATIRTVKVNHKAVQQALQELSFTDRALIVDRACDTMKEDWDGKLAAHERFDLIDYFRDIFEDFRYDMLHTLVEA